jgi:very-short-patch-repair endonuclease
MPKTAGLTRHQKVNDDKVAMARSLRVDSTSAEDLLWQALRARKHFGLKFRRQQLAHGFILDFYCEPARLAIELDGAVHEGIGQKAYDKERDAALEGAGVLVLRFKNEMVLGHMDAVLKRIAEVAAKRMV